MKKLSRRDFMQNGALATVAMALPSATVVGKKDIFVHHVYFWLKKPDSAADKAKLTEGLEKLTKIKTIKMAHIGTPAETDRSVIDRSYAVSWLLFFDNLEEEEKYQKDPVHLKFVEDYSHLWERVVVYDSVGKKH